VNQQSQFAKLLGYITKQADLADIPAGISEVWNKMDTPQRIATVGGLGAAGYGLYNSLMGGGDDDAGPDWLSPAIGLAGLGAAGYGLSGGNFSNLLPNLGKIVGMGVNKQPQAPQTPPPPAMGELDESILNIPGAQHVPTRTSLGHWDRKPPANPAAPGNLLSIAQFAATPEGKQFVMPNGKPNTEAMQALLGQQGKALSMAQQLFPKLDASALQEIYNGIENAWGGPLNMVQAKLYYPELAKVQELAHKIRMERPIAR
jgi:hypothetical protein